MISTTKHKPSQTELAVIGSTGKTGKRVCNLLKEKGIQVREASRKSINRFDWEDKTTWAPTLKGIRSVYVTYYPDLAVPTAPADISDFCDIAIQQGVQHIVLLSGRGESAAQHCEDIVKESGLQWTIVRASWFNQNFLEGAFRPMIDAEIIALPVSNTREPFIDADDIAEVVATSLTEPGHKNKLYEVTGPRLLTFADVAKEISQSSGKNIQYKHISQQVFLQQLKTSGMPDEVIEMMMYLFTEVLDGRNEYISDGVSECLGRPAKDMRDYLRDNPINNISSLVG
jgi:uncharacterized protein YbjT (DUF2867 family)